MVWLDMKYEYKNLSLKYIIVLYLIGSYKSNTYNVVNSRAHLHVFLKVLFWLWRSKADKHGPAHLDLGRGSRKNYVGLKLHE